MKLSPYIMFNGDCEEALKVYEKVGGKLEGKMRFDEAPGGQAPPNWGKKIMHAAMKIGDTLLMTSDAPPGHYSKPQGFSVALGVDSVDQAEKAFKILSEGGEVKMPLQETFWAERFAMVVDRWGIPWMVNYEKKHQ